MKVERKYNTYVDDSIYKRIRLQSLLKKTLLVLVLILVGNFFVAKIFNYNLLEDIGKRVLKLAGIYTEPIPSITMESNGWKDQEEGSYQIVKSAKWNGRSEAKITLDVKSLPSINSKKDVIFVLDKSGSMKGDKIQRLKEDSIELIEDMLVPEKDNQFALVTFSTDSEIVTSFTKDKNQMIEAINSMEAKGTTNYNAALKNVMQILRENDYHQTEERELVIMLLTDGYPCEDTPNEIGTYALLKEQYPYATVNGVEYEMGSKFSSQLVRVSDNQFKAWMANLDNVLLEAAIGPDKYKEFTITDTINSDYFEVRDKSDIKVLVNDMEVESKFDLVNENGKQKVVWDLTENYVSGAEITMEIKIHLKEAYVNTDDTYPTNSELNIESKLPNLNKETHNTKTDTPVLSLKYDVVYDTNPPKACNRIKKVQTERHYVFENVNENENEPVCKGYIFKGWEVVEDDVKQVNDEIFIMPDHDVQLRGIWSKPVISKAMDGTVNEKTTLYRVVENGFTSGSEFVGKYTKEADDSFSNPKVNANIYYYKDMATMNNIIFGGFCWQIIRTTKTGGVKVLYNGVASEDNKCNNTYKDQQIDKMSAFNLLYGSPADEGYMYNKRYVHKYDLYTYTSVLTNYSEMYSEYTYWFSQEFTYDEASGLYTLVNPESHVWGDMNIEDYRGWYFCGDRETKSCSTLYYLAGKKEYFGVLSDGIQERPKYVFGSSYTIDDSGNYTLKGLTELDSKDWESDYWSYSKYDNRYICSDFKSTTCSTLYYVVEGSYYGIYIAEEDILFGNSFTYENGEYTLTDPEKIGELRGYYGKRHYSCANNTGKCTSIRYYYHLYDSSCYYIELTNGKSVENALEEMLWADDVNQTDSTIKKFIDTWYEENIKGKPFEEYIEDTIYCNDRTIRKLGGWDPNAFSSKEDLYFSTYYRDNRTSAKLVCSNETDKFSTSNPKAKLKYPIGLMTKDEAALISDSKEENFLNTRQDWWLISPGVFSLFFADVYNISFVYGIFYYQHSNVGLAVRPVISLRPNTEYSKGDGTTDNPYIISVGE